MPGSLYNAQNVVVGHAVCWMKPFDPDTPAELVADTTALFDADAWETAGWIGAGATNEGFRVNVESSTTPIPIEEQSTPVGENLESRTMSIEAALAEDTLENQRLAWGGADITVAAATATDPGTRRMRLSSEILYYAVALEMRNFHGLARRIFVPKMSVTGSGDVAFRRAADKRAYPVRFNALTAPENIEIVDIVAAPTGV